MKRELRAKYSPYPATPRVKRYEYVTFDDHYGISKVVNRDARSAYRFGVEINDQLLLGQAAYDFLVQPWWDGKSFLDLIPDFSLCAEHMMDPNNPALSVPNPEYPGQLEVYNAAKTEMLRLMHEVLKLVCRVTFPHLTDTGYLLQWHEKIDGVWVEIPVEVGKYPNVNKFVTVLEYDHRQYASYLSIATGCGMDKQKILSKLLALGSTQQTGTQTGAGSTTINPGGISTGTGTGVSLRHCKK